MSSLYGSLNKLNIKMSVRTLSFKLEKLDTMEQNTNVNLINSSNYFDIAVQTENLSMSIFSCKTSRFPPSSKSKVIVNQKYTNYEEIDVINL